MSSQKLLPIILLVGLFAILLVPVAYALVSTTLVAPTGVSGSPTLQNLTNVSRGYFGINISLNETRAMNVTHVELYNLSSLSAAANMSNNTPSNHTIAFWNLTNLVNGSYRAEVRIFVNSSQEGNYSLNLTVNFTVDTEAPSNIRLNKSNGIESLRNENTSDTTPELYINVTELMGRDQFVNVTVFRNNISYHSTTTTNGSFVLVNLSAFPYNGSHELRLQAIDRAGNSANGSIIYLTIDNGAPTTVSPTVKSSSFTAGAINSASCTASDNTNGTGIQSTALEVKEPDGTLVSVSDGAEKAWPKIGEHTVTCTATDFLNQSSTSTVKFTTKGPSSGDIVTTTTSPTPTAAPVKEEQTLVAVEVGKVATVTFTKAELPVSEIILTPTEAGTNVKVSAETISAPSQGAPPASAADKEVVAFGYLDLKSTVAATAKVKFSVTRTWLTSNSVESNNVALYRLEGGTAWKKLTTTKLSEDATTVVYSAETPGFSVFAVAAEKPKAAAASPTSSPAASPATSPTSTAKPTTSPAAGKTGAPTDIWLYTGIAVAIIVIVVAVVLAMRRKK